MNSTERFHETLGILRRRNRAGSRDTFALFDVLASLRGVLVGSQRVVGRFGIVRGLEVAFEKRHAPAATGSRSAALGKLARSTRSMNPQEVENLPLRDVKAVANRVVRFHEQDSDALSVLQKRRMQLDAALDGSPFQADLFEQRIENRSHRRLLQLQRDGLLELLVIDAV